MNSPLLPESSMIQKRLYFFLILTSVILNILSLVYVSYILAWLTFPFLFYALLKIRGNIQSFVTGALFGGVSSLALNLWMLTVIPDYAEGTVLTGVFTWLASSIVLALIFGFQFVLYSVLKLPESRKFYFVHNLLLLASLWVIFEWIRAEGLSGIPWLSYSTGVTQGSNLYLIQTAVFGGVYGLSFLIICAAYIIAFAFYKTRWKLLFIPPLIFSCQFLTGLWLYKNIEKEVSENSNAKLSVSLILPGLSPETVWNDKSADGLVNHLLTLNREANLNPSDLLIWSETVVPWTYASDDDFLKELTKETSRNNSSSLIGMNSVHRVSSDVLNNSAYFLDSAGKVRGRYDKQQLLTFVEKPLFSEQGSFILPFLGGKGLKMFSGDNKLPIKTPWGDAGILLCNESTYSSLAVKLAESGAAYLVNMGNDSWFSGNFITRQHFYNCRFRAVETRKDIVINNNMGFSGVIRASGKIAATYESGVSGVKNAEVFPNRLPSNNHTFFIYLLFSITALMAVNQIVNKQK